MNLGFEPKLSDFPECAFDDYTTLLHLWALHSNHLCGARSVCFLEPEQSCGVYGKDGDAEARNPVTRKELGMGQRREGPCHCYLEGPLSGYRASSLRLTAPAFLLTQTSAGPNARMPHRWAACFADASAIFTVTT